MKDWRIVVKTAETIPNPKANLIVSAHDAIQALLGQFLDFTRFLSGGFQKLFTRFGKWSAKLDLKKVLLKPSPQLEFAFVDGDGACSCVWP